MYKKYANANSIKTWQEWVIVHVIMVDIYGHNCAPLLQIWLRI